eukprot:COSAG01_NODE_1035_length_11997_cov_95.509665_5_plen_101_part_00
MMADRQDDPGPAISHHMSAFLRLRRIRAALKRGRRQRGRPLLLGGRRAAGAQLLLAAGLGLRLPSSCSPAAGSSSKKRGTRALVFFARWAVAYPPAGAVG